MFFRDTFLPNTRTHGLTRRGILRKDLVVEQPREGLKSHRPRGASTRRGGRGGTSQPVSRILCQPRLTGDHPSGTAVAGGLVRSTRRLGRAARLRRCPALAGRTALLTLLRVGFTEPPQSPAALVVSYTTVSPLP